MNCSRRAAIAAMLAAHAGFGRAQRRPLQVVASFSILADLLRNIGGTSIEVTALVGPDADAHMFEPRPTDAKRLADADLVVVNGLGFEGWIDRLVRVSGYRGPLIVASAGLQPRTLNGAPDPHAWQSLTCGQHYVCNLRDALLRLAPADAAGLQSRTTQYLARLQALDDSIRKALEPVPKARRRVITSHNAFGYFAAAYGIEFIAAQGRSTESEASAASVARLIDQIRSQKAAAVFVENISDPRLMARIAKESGAKLGGRLYSDALSAPGTEADSYLKLFAHNAKTIITGLQTAQAS